LVSWQERALLTSLRNSTLVLLRVSVNRTGSDITDKNRIWGRNKKKKIRGLEECVYIIQRCLIQ
jgi:hypothetical protein